MSLFEALCFDFQKIGSLCLLNTIDQVRETATCLCPLKSHQSTFFATQDAIAMHRAMLVCIIQVYVVPRYIWLKVILGYGVLWPVTQIHPSMAFICPELPPIIVLLPSLSAARVISAMMQHHQQAGILKLQFAHLQRFRGITFDLQKL